MNKEKPLHQMTTKQLEKKLKELHIEHRKLSDYGSPFGDTDTKANLYDLENKMAEVVRNIRTKKGVCETCGYDYHPNTSCSEFGPKARIDFKFDKLTCADIDDIYEYVDESFRNGQFKEIDDVFCKLTPQFDDMTIHHVLSWLTASLPAKSRLPNRKPFFDKAKDLYREEILRGLE